MKALRFALYPAVASLALFWLLAFMDYACASDGLSYTCYVITRDIWVTYMGLYAGSALLLGVLFFVLYGLRDSRILPAFYGAVLLLFADTFAFETGIWMVDYKEFHMRVVTLQIVQPLPSFTFFTNEFLFYLSLGALVILIYGWLLRQLLSGKVPLKYESAE